MLVFSGVDGKVSVASTHWLYTDQSLAAGGFAGSDCCWPLLKIVCLPFCCSCRCVRTSKKGRSAKISNTRALFGSRPQFQEQWDRFTDHYICRMCAICAIHKTELPRIADNFSISLFLFIFSTSLWHVQQSSSSCEVDESGLCLDIEGNPWIHIRLTRRCCIPTGQFAHFAGVTSFRSNLNDMFSTRITDCRFVRPYVALV